MGLHHVTVLAPSSNSGRRLFGAAAFAFGVLTLVWPAYYDWLGLHYVNAEVGRLLADAASASQVVGGAAMQFRRTVKTGSIVLGAVYLAIALLSVLRIVAAPHSYDPYGNFFEQFSLATGAAIVYARLSSAWAPALVKRLGRILFGACAASFAIEQAIHIDPTASLVPSWLPPGQAFWAIATTVAFALAAGALWINRAALLASRLLTVMLGVFGLVVWIPLLISRPHSHGNWSETIETFAITGSAWILADLLGQYRRK